MKWSRTVALSLRKPTRSQTLRGCGHAAIGVSLTLLVLVSGPMPLDAQATDHGSATEVSPVPGRFSLGLSAASVRFNEGASWGRYGALAEFRLRDGLAAWAEYWGARRPTILCPGSQDDPRCRETSDARGWALGAKALYTLGPGDLWAGFGVGRYRYDSSGGLDEGPHALLKVGYRVTVLGRLDLSPRAGADLFGGSSFGGWNHFGVEAALRVP